MELSALKFAVDTSELERAGKAIGDVVQSMDKFNTTARSTAQTGAILARAAKDQAKANLDNAKAQDQKLKSTITADKADRAAAEATEKSARALEKHTKATKENVSILERQTDIYDFMTQGFSRGQASILATAKATGQLSSELKKILEDQKQFSKNPFDNSDTGLKRMNITLKETADALQFVNAGYNLTTKQARELSNDLSRLEVSLKAQGKSYQEITQAQAAYKKQFVDTAAEVNRSSDALAVVAKQRKEVASATNYVIQADQKMAAALNASNSALDKGATDSLVRYETALRKSGISQDLATEKLAKYKIQLAQVQAQEKKRSEQHLARALSPQLTDIGVSLYSGQAPLTVLLQQGGQILDLFKQSGIEADKFGKTMRDSFYSMVPAMGVVAKGMASFVAGAFVDAGKGITSFVGSVTGISAAIEVVNRVIASGGEENFKYIATLQRLGNIASTVTAVGLGAILVVLTAMALEYKNIIKSEHDLSVALATSGGAMGMSKQEAISYAEGMQSIGVSTLKAIDAITEFAKAGKIGKDGLDLIIKSAVDLEKYAGVSLKEIAKEYAKLQDEPTKALTDIAEKTGLVDKATLDYVASLEQQGDKTKAAEEATKALTAANNAAVAEIKSNLSPIEALWDDIRSAIGKVKQEIYDLTTSNEVVGGMRVVWQTLAVTVSELWFVLKGVGKELGGIAAQIGTMNLSAADMLNPATLAAKIATGFNNDAAKNIRQQMIEDAKTARAEQDKLVASIMNQGTAEKKNFSDSKESNAQYAAWRKDNEKALEREYSKAERLGLKKKQLQNDLNAGIIDEVKYKAALAGWERIIMGEKKPKDTSKQEAREMDKYYDTLNKVAGLTSDYNNTLATLGKLRKEGRISEEEYVSAVEDLIKQQPFYIKQQKEINDAHELYNKLLGSADLLGKEYYTTLEKIAKYEANGTYTADQAEKARQALFERTELYKKQIDYISQSTKESQKLREETMKFAEETGKINADLDIRVALMGQTEYAATQMRIELERQAKVNALNLELERKRKDIQDKVQNGNMDPIDAAVEEGVLLKAYQDRLNSINREAAVKYAEDFMKEFNAIRDGISDSIVTALFEGGKAGSKKLRDVVINALKRPVNLVVNAVVNTLMGNVLGSILGGGGGAGGGIGSSIMSSIGGSALSSSLGLSSIGSSIATSIMAGYQGATLAPGLMGPTTAGATGFMGLGNALSAIPGWGIALAAVVAIGALLSKKSTPHMGAGSTYSAAGGLESIDLEKANEMGFKAKYNKETQAFTDQIAKGIGMSLDETAKTFGKDVGYEVSTAFADDSSKDGAWGQFRVKKKGQDLINWGTELAAKNNRWAPREYADGEAGQKQYMADIAKSARDALKDAIGDVSWATDMLDALGDSPTLEQVSATIDQINAAKKALDGFGLNVQGFADLTDKAVSALVEASGGVQSLLVNMQSFYDNFYSEEEKKANVQRDITKALKDAGLEMPKSRAEYRKMVEEQMALGEAGAKKLAVLLKYSGAFASITEDGTKAAQDELDRQEAARKAIIERQKEILKIQIDAAEAQVNIFQKLFDFLENEVKKLYGSVESTAKMQLSQAREVIQQAVASRTLPDQGTLEDAVGTITGSFNNNNYATKVEAERDRLRFAAQLDDLKSIAGKNLNSAKTTLDVLKLQLAALEDAAVMDKKQLDGLYAIDDSVKDVVDAVNNIGNGDGNGTETGNTKPIPYSGGDSGVAPAGANPYTTRVSYGADEALSDFEKFKAWYVGLRVTSKGMAEGYKTPDWMRINGLMQKDGSNESLFGDYLFFKNNPKYAKDYEKIMSGGTSDYSTTGESIVKTDLDKLPAEIRDYYKSNTNTLLAYEGAGVDPVLAYKVAKYGAESIGIDPKKTNVTEYMRTHKWTENGIVESNNPSDLAFKPYKGYNLARYDNQNQVIVDVDGTLYTLDGKPVGTASRDQMIAIYGRDYVNNTGGNYGSTMRSKLYNQNIGYGYTPEQYYSELRKYTDQMITSGWTAQQIVDAMNSTGASLDDMAHAYGVSASEIANNLRAGGATNLPTFADGGMYQGGLALVGEEGPELINFSSGGQVHTAKQTANILNQGDVCSQLERLNSKVDMLEAAARSTAVTNTKIAKILDRVSPDGNSLAVTTVAGSVTTVV